MLVAVVSVTTLMKRNERREEDVAVSQSGSIEERAHQHVVEAAALMKTAVEE